MYIVSTLNTTFPSYTHVFVLETRLGASSMYMNLILLIRDFVFPYALMSIKFVYLFKTTMGYSYLNVIFLYAGNNHHLPCSSNTTLNLDLHIIFWLTPILSTSPLRISWILSSPWWIACMQNVSVVCISPNYMHMYYSSLTVCGTFLVSVSHLNVLLAIMMICTGLWVNDSLASLNC